MTLLLELKSQIAISSYGHGGWRKSPYAFAEHGAIMAANVLKTSRAIHMSVFVVRAFELKGRVVIEILEGVPDALPM